ncbi:MAG: diphthine--ammonia ligase [Defluviitaleaceae bacterium]|nr:diphthine--ammonia ligase [Defluviitaleaceae bacterium]
MKFAMSYSGGKESALALHKFTGQGNTPVALITTYNQDTDRSLFHGLSSNVLKRVSQSLSIPLILTNTTAENYNKDFEIALKRAKETGAVACVFGDIDIEGHREWATQRCDNVGIKAIFPLWDMPRQNVVYELVDSGFVASLTVVNTKFLDEKFLGKQLTKELAKKIVATGADICGENGEYHTFVSNSPMFAYPVDFVWGKRHYKDGYAMLEVI